MPRLDPLAKRYADNAAVLENSRNNRDITADYPDAGDLETREACQRDLRLFLETYFANAFDKRWSDDHLAVIGQMQKVILDGGMFALAMPRGGGKTAVSIRAAIWAMLYGHRRFVCLVAATEDHAKKLLKPIKNELTSNAPLARDFRQVCYPLQRLENNGRKCIGQLFDGEQTRISWGADQLTFPIVPDWACDGVNVSGSAISVAGLTGAIRGQSHTLPSGRILRPELVILDDPQTRESAMSLSQSATRAAIINGDVLGMAGPGQDIAVIMPCTVIRSGDMADVLLDRKKNPRWSGRLTKMVYAFPTNEKLWDQYRDVLNEGLSIGDGDNGAAGNAFYAEHRAAMDAGSKVAWEERFKPNELSAIQHAMNLKFQDERSFFAEYQNEPLPENDINPDDLTAEQVAAKINRMPRGAVPSTATRLTAMIDVHGTVHYYCVVAYDDNFTGQIIDYGTYPDQKRPYFTLRDAKVTFKQTTKATSQEGQIYAGLEATTDLIFNREYKRDDGAVLTIERCLIDSNWGPHTGLVLKFCRETKWAAAITPSRGRGVGVSSMPMSEYTRRPGDRVGLNWHLSVVKEHRSLRRVEFDSNFWKSFVHARFATAMGDKSCLSIFGDKPEQHRLFAEHITAEHRVVTKREGSSRTVDEWKWNINRPDNHWLDCLVGACVAASMQGVALAESSVAPGDKPKRVSFAELQRRRRA